ncbi:E2F-associated phosphoprotein [Plasmodiophora brassicae]
MDIDGRGGTSSGHPDGEGGRPQLGQTLADSWADDDYDKEDLKYKSEDELYDEGLDEEDAKWIREMCGGSDATDAILSCPACFTTVSMLCQRHERFANQYRAVFVQNVVVDENQAVSPMDDAPLEPGETYCPVFCKVCRVEIGVRDADEVYHFFHVLPSQT